MCAFCNLALVLRPLCVHFAACLTEFDTLVLLQVLLKCFDYNNHIAFKEAECFHQPISQSVQIARRSNFTPIYLVSLHSIMLLSVTTTLQVFCCFHSSCDTNQALFFWGRTLGQSYVMTAHSSINPLARQQLYPLFTY